LLARRLVPAHGSLQALLSLRKRAHQLRGTAIDTVFNVWANFLGTTRSGSAGDCAIMLLPGSWRKGGLIIAPA
jgi:hypothetical protein